MFVHEKRYKPNRNYMYYMSNIHDMFWVKVKEKQKQPIEKNLAAK